MSTTKQKKLARVIVENEILDAPLNSGQMLAKVGYSKNLVKQPGRVIESEGVQEELEILGFTESNAMNVVSEIMLNPDAQDNNRLKASEMVFKVKGTFAPEKKAVVNLNIETTNKEAQDIANKYEEELKGKLLK